MSLRVLGLPEAQWNDRTAMVILALADLTPTQSWSEALSQLIGVLAIMAFISQNYKVTYAPNSRETIRRFSLHQMIDAGMVLQNPDDPSRPTNSAKNVYQLTPLALATLQKRGTAQWPLALEAYLQQIPSLRERYAQSRALQKLPVILVDGTQLYLSPGGQNVLVKAILEEFAPRFVQGGIVLYVGDTSVTDSGTHINTEGLETLGIAKDHHGKIPDVIIRHLDKGWLVLIEAVISHGPVNGKRRDDLRMLFQHVDAGFVYVTAFLTRRDMTKYLPEIAWETEVWIAESPDHLIHFNGERFLGPYEKEKSIPSA